MIDLSFLTEAEQEAILKVLNRDAELKKAEEERVKHLQDVVDDESEYKYKSGQWFYEAKSKRHRDKIHGAELVRASIRKRKKPTTLAELSELSKDSSKRRWVNSVNQDIFIPPELYGVMEAPDEAEEDIMVKKQEGNQSSKKVSFPSEEKEQDKLRNGTLAPPKPRLNPFNAEGLQDEPDYHNEDPSPNPEYLMNGTGKPKSELMSSLAKYGVKLPYPEPSKATLNAPRLHNEENSQNQDVLVPVPKPRKMLKVNGQPPDRSNSTLMRDDSFSTSKPRGILKRRSSSSSTDSESIRISQSVEPSKMVLPGSPIYEVGQQNYFDELDATSDNAPDRQKQVRFSEKIQQRPLSPNPELYMAREVGEYGILDPGLSAKVLHNGFVDLKDSDNGFVDLRDSDNGFGELKDSEDSVDSLTKVPEQNANLENQGVSLEFERMEVTPKEDLSKRNAFRLEAGTDLSIEPPSNILSGVEPIYSVVKKSPAASAPSQEQDFDLDDALMEPRFPGQRGKTQNIYINEKPLEFGKSYSGGGKIAFESKYPSKKEKESYRISSEELIPERSIITESSHRTMEDKPVIINQDDKPAESVAFWRKPIILGNQEPTQSSVDLPDEQKTSTHILKVSPGVDKVEDTFGKSDPENLTSKTAPGEDNKETKYKSTFHNRFEAEHKPVGLPSNIPVVQNRFESSRTDGPLDRSLEKKGRKEDLPKSSHFKVMSLKERMNDMPREQMSNPSQFQSLKHFWNVEEKNPHRETAVTSPDKILAHVSSRNKPTRTDFKQRSSEIPADDVLLPSVSDSLSEEEQTSQKVATWLAKTPTVYGVGQMDPDDQAYSVEEIVEDVQQSPPPKKPDNESASARQKLREEALEVPKNTEIARSRTEEIRMMPQVDPYSNARKQTTITVSPMSQKSVETKAPAVNPNPSDSGFYNRVLQMSNKQSPAKEIVIAEPRREPLQESKPKTVAPENSASEFTISFEKFNNGMSNEAAKKKESSLPNKESMAEEQIEKSVVPKGQDQQDFISALKRLEIEASKPPPLPDVEAEYQDKLLEEEISQNAVSPVKSSRMNFVNFVPASEPNDLDTSTDRSVEFQMQHSDVLNKEPATEETIERSTVPSKNGNEDFSIALRKLELEATEHQPDGKDTVGINQKVEFEKPELQVALQTNLPPEAGETLVEEPPIKSTRVESQENAADFHKRLLQLEEQAKIVEETEESRSDISYSSSQDNGDDLAQQPEVSYGLRYTPDVFDGQGKLPVAEEPPIKSTRVESQENAADFHNRLLQLEEQAKIPEEQAKIPEEPEKFHSDINDSFSGGEDMAQLPKVSYGLRSTPDVFDGQGKLPVVEEPPIESTRVESQENAADFHNRLLQLEEQAKIPEEPEDLLDESVKVSQFPNREVFISKKVYSSMESMHSSADSESGKAKEKEVGSQSKPKDFSDLQSYDYSRNEELANPPSPKTPGSYPDNGDILYTKPEVGSPEVLNSKPGKPALSESPSDKTSSKGDKYEFMAMKAQDESISKVLDWFSRSTEIVDNSPPIQTGSNEKESEGDENLSTVSTSYLEDPNTSGISLSMLSGIWTQSGDHNSDIPNADLASSISLVEDNSTLPEQKNLKSEDRSPLQFGKSGGGSGKISNQETIDMEEDHGQGREAKYLDLFDGKKDLGSEEEPNGTLKQNLISIATESMPNQQIPVGTEKPHSRSSLSSQSDIENDVLLTNVNSIENATPPRLNSNLEAGNCLEFGKSGGGSGKSSSPRQDIFENKKPMLLNTDSDADQPNVMNDEPLMQANSIANNEYQSELDSNLQAENCLEFGKSGGGSGKKSSPTQDIFEGKKPRLSLSSTDTENEQPDVMNDEILTQANRVECASPPGLNLEGANCPEFGKSEGESRKTVIPTQDIFQVEKQKPSSSSIDIDTDYSDIKNEELLTQANGEYDASPPSLKSNIEAVNGLEFGKSGGGSGKKTSPTQDISEDKKPSLSLSSTDTDNQTDIMNDVPLTMVNHIEDTYLSGPVKSNLEAEHGLEFDKSEGGSDKISSLSQEMSEVKKPRLSFSSTDSTDYDQSDTIKVHPLTPAYILEESTLTANKNVEADNPVEFAKSGVNKDGFDEVEELKDEKEPIDLLKEESPSPVVAKAETPDNAGNGPIYHDQPEKLEHTEILDVFPVQNTVKSYVKQRSVSDIKQLWEGDRSALPEAKKTVLSSSKPTFSRTEKSISSRSSSVESDDRSSPSIVTFQKVLVEEEEENQLLQIDQLKSFWENEKNVVDAKPPDSTSVKNGSLDADKVSALADPRYKFKKRHTFHSFFEKDPSAMTAKHPPGRSVSVSESTNDNLKDQPKSNNTFQNLRSFWNVDSKATNNSLKPKDKAFSESKIKQFRSNPDLSKESFVAKIKSKLESQSLEDIREDAPAVYQVELVKDRKSKAPLLRMFSKQKSNDSSNSVEEQENDSVLQDSNPPEFNAVSKSRSTSPFGVSDNEKLSEAIVKPVQRPEKVSEFSLRLRKVNEFSNNSLEDPTSVNIENSPKSELANGNIESKNFVNRENEERKPEKKTFLIKPIIFDTADADTSPKNGWDSMAQVENGEQVQETVDRTVQPQKHSDDFDRALQKLYNESLEASPVADVKLNQQGFMSIQSPEENSSKVLTISSSKEKGNLQRTSSKEKGPSFKQPIVINLSSKKINICNDTPRPLIQPYQNAENNVDEMLPSSILVEPQKIQAISGSPTDQQNVNLCDNNETSEVSPAEQQSKKEIVERIEMPTIVPRAPFNNFDEGLKKLYEESRNLTETKPVVNYLQKLPVKQESVINKRATSVSLAPIILEQEIGETIEKASEPTKIYHAKSSEPLQKASVNDEEEPFMENAPSNHVTSEESQPRLSENFRVEGTVSEMSPKAKEDTEEKVDVLHYEKSQEPPSEQDLPFTDVRQSTPTKEKNSSLRKSTLELYLEVPYRREMSKSMDFELDDEYAALDVDKERYPLNSSSLTEDAPVNSFPQNAETLKRLSQSVPAFIQDETDGRDTDSASESSFQIGRHKKSPSSLTNLSGSSGMASMSSVSGSVMSIYSGDFGNVDVKGDIEFSVEYMDELKQLLIYVYQCRDLAAADVKKQRSDPYVKAYLLPEKAKMGKRKTAVKKKSLNPVYNEILKYKIPKQSAVAQTLNLSVWHHDALGRNSFLGEVNLNLGTWDWSNKQRRWYPLEPRTPAAGMGLENRGEMKLSLKYVPESPTGQGTKPSLTGEVYIWIKDCVQLPMLRDNKINSFVKCTVLPDTSRKSRQKTRTVDKTPSPIFNHTMVYDGFKEADLREACVELTVWDHNRLSNHFLGGLRIGLGTGKSYGTAVDWMDSTHEESAMWEKMMASPNTWVDGLLPLRMFKMAKLTK